MKISGETNTFKVVGECPSEWSFDSKPVPILGVPRQLFAVSNRPIELTPIKTRQPRPMIQNLDSAAMFIWCYYQAPGDPEPEYPGMVPNYSRYALPLRYLDSEVEPAYAAREWNPRDFIRRRIGFETSETKVTVWIWEGTSATPQDIGLAENIVASIRPV